MDRKASVNTLWFASALSLHGWNVVASHPTEGSNVAIEARTVLASLPLRPLFSLTIEY